MGRPGREEALGAAAFLRARKEAILEAWRRRARHELPAAQDKSEPVLTDSLPTFLDALADALEQGNPEHTGTRPIAAVHAAERFALGDYDLKQVLGEYRLLRHVVLEHLEEDFDLAAPDRDVVLDVFDDGKTAAAEQYARRVGERQAEVRDALRIAEERLGYAVWAANVGVWDWDLRTGRLDWSRRLKELWGYLDDDDFPETMEGFWSRIHADDVARVRAAIESCLGSRVAYDVEYRVVRPDGSVRWIAGKGRATYDASGAAVRMAGVALDITDRVEAEQRLHRSIDLFTYASRATEDLIWDWNIATERLTWNDSVCAKLGYPPSVLETHIAWWYEHIHPEDRERVVAGIHAAIDCGEDRWTDEYRFARADGAFVDVVDRGFVVRDAARKATRMIGAMRDVTEEKRAVEALKLSEASFRTLAESMPQIVWTARPDGFVDWYNQWWYDYTGARRGSHWDDPGSPLHPDDLERTHERWRHSVDTGEIYEIEYRFRRASDGQYRWHLGRAVPLRDETGAIVRWIGTNTDIHDQRSALQALRDEREMRERFVSTLTHDLRSPLTTAKISAQLVARKATEPDRVIAFSAKAVDAIERVDKMIHDLLDVSRIEAGAGLELELARCDVVALAREVSDDMAVAFGADIRLSAPAALVGMWSCRELRRAIENLVSNACKHGDRSRPISVSVERDGDQAVLAVHNCGPPIPESDQRTIFESFRRSATKARGWGIGLGLVKGVVDAHHGTVGVESSRAHGTKFVVRLPLDART